MKEKLSDLPKNFFLSLLHTCMETHFFLKKDERALTEKYIVQERNQSLYYNEEMEKELRLCITSHNTLILLKADSSCADPKGKQQSWQKKIKIIQSNRKKVMIISRFSFFISESSCP